MGKNYPTAEKNHERKIEIEKGSSNITKGAAISRASPKEQTFKKRKNEVRETKTPKHGVTNQRE